MSKETAACLRLYEDNRHELQIFCNSVREFFEEHPVLTAAPAVVHSVRTRMKDREHVKEKISRKNGTGGERITPANFLERMTDLAGVRVLHLYQDQSVRIHEAIVGKTASKDWCFYEKPKAFTWDPESEKFFRGLGLRTELRPTYYTSLHYIVKPRKDSPLACEIQVRTLFEEVWGEIDHLLNYPKPTDSVACAEQLRVLSKLVGAGSRLADAIFRSHREHASLRSAGRHRRRAR